MGVRDRCCFGELLFQWQSLQNLNPFLPTTKRHISHLQLGPVGTYVWEGINYHSITVTRSLVAAHPITDSCFRVFVQKPGNDNK